MKPIIGLAIAIGIHRHPTFPSPDQNPNIAQKNVNSPNIAIACGLGLPFIDNERHSANHEGMATTNNTINAALHAALVKATDADGVWGVVMFLSTAKKTIENLVSGFPG